jgi:hypothetical protein
MSKNKFNRDFHAANTMQFVCGYFSTKTFFTSVIIDGSHGQTKFAGSKQELADFTP